LRILAVADSSLAARLDEYAEEMKRLVAAMDEEVRSL
jgi:phosphoribosylcarboxyaminoimidazole (NCAIR) mutase